MIEIHLYGKLRQFSTNGARPGEALLHVEAQPGETLETLLARLGIPAEQVNHIFFNSKLLATRASHATLYDLPMARSAVESWELDMPLSPHDRLGLFGLDIPMLSM